MNVGQKRCTKCRTIKHLDSFYIRRKSSGELHPQCKECMKITRRKARTCRGCNREYFHIGTGGARRPLCPECVETKRYCAKCDVVKTPDDFYDSWSRCKRCVSVYNVCNRYGISEEDYLDLVARVGGKCQICGSEAATLNLDHCHDTENIRGLLCSPCNQGLGFFRDSIPNLQRAIQYLNTASPTRIH